MLKQVLAVLAIFGAANLVADNTEVKKEEAAPVVTAETKKEVVAEEAKKEEAAPVATAEAKKEETK